MVYIVRADSWWYRFDDEDKARTHYKYLLDNINSKYKQIEKIYLAQYDGDKTPKILELWKRQPQQLEEEQGYGK